MNNVLKPLIFGFEQSVNLVFFMEKSSFLVWVPSLSDFSHNDWSNFQGREHRLYCRLYYH